MYYLAWLKLLIVIIALLVIVYVVWFVLKSRRQFAPGNYVNDEKIQHSGRANFLYGESSTLSDGGYLILTDRSLWFFPHGINISTQIRTIPRKNIKRFFARKSLRVIPNGLGLELVNGERQNFVVKKRNAWIEALEQKGRSAK